jgi:hypothetical protein
MAGLPASLSIAIWFVAALWVIGAVAYWLDYGAEVLGLTALISTVAAVAEWQSLKHDKA